MSFSQVADESAFSAQGFLTARTIHVISSGDGYLSSAAKKKKYVLRGWLTLATILNLVVHPPQQDVTSVQILTPSDAPKSDFSPYHLRYASALKSLTRVKSMVGVVISIVCQKKLLLCDLHFFCHKKSW